MFEHWKYLFNGELVYHNDPKECWKVYEIDWETNWILVDYIHATFPTGRYHYSSNLFEYIRELSLDPT